MLSAAGHILADAHGWASLLDHHLTDDARRHLFGSTILALVVGIALLFWGVRIGRLVVVAVFFGVGGGVGYALRKHLAVSPVLTVPLGGLLCAAAGGLLYRALSAMLTGTILTLITVGIYCSVALLPRLDVDAILRPRSSEIRLESVQTDELHRALGEFSRQIRRLWQLQPRLIVVGLLSLAGSAILGLMLGIFAPRGAIIVWTSAAGSILVVAAVLALLAQKAPDVLARIDAYPSAVPAAAAALCALGAIFQHRRSRRKPAAGMDLAAAVGKAT